ncbi:leucine-rich repeat protein, partial [Tannerella forsythia]
VRVTTEQSTLNHSVGAYYASEGNKPSGHVTVPATVSHGGTTYQVTAIGSVVFRGCRGIKSVTLAKSIAEIKDHAFEKCTGLKEVVVAWDTPLAIAAEVFQDVPLHEVKLTVPVGKKAAYTSASVWKNFIVEEGEPTTFYDFKVGKLYYKKTSGTTVSVSREKNGENGTSPFYADENKPSGNIAIPATVRYGNTTYHVTGIGEGAFATCSGLTNLTIPSSITNIELGAFLQCSGLTNVTIPNSVTNIGKGIFYDCSGLTHMIIPNSIKNIPEIMFMGCTKLTHVTIPSSVTKIEREAFVNCKSLKEMMVYWDAPPVIDANTFEGVALHQVKLIVPVGKKAAYTSAAVWKNFNPIVEASSPVLSVSPAALSMDASGRSRTVTVVANTPWTTTSSATWLTVSPLAGSNNGTVTVTAAAYTGAAPRTATITFMTGNLTRTVSVTQTGTTAVIPATGVAVEPTSLKLEVGQARPLTATVLPETATTQTVTWTTDNAAIATVNESGIVKGVAPGTAVITATTTDGSHTATCTVTVVRSSSPVVKVTSLKLSATTFKTEAQIIFQLKVTVLPANATDPSVTFTSSDPSIASVDAVTGLVTVYRKGTARITVTANDGSGVTAVCEVTYTVANERVDASVRVYAHDGALRLTLSNPETVHIYNVDGAMVKTLDLPAGDHIQPLPSGVYFVRVGEKVEKIFVK